MHDLTGKRIVVISRCARTLYVFRRSLIAETAKCGAEVSTFGAGGDGFEDDLERCGIRFEQVPVGIRSLSPRADLRLFFRLLRKFRLSRPDIVHAFTVKPAIFATLAAWVAGVPRRVVTITGLGHAFTTGSPVLRSIVTVLYRVALRKAHVVFFQNSDDLGFFVGRGIVRPETARLIPGSGVDIQRFAPVPLPCQGGRAPRFLMIARLLREKGVREYVEAACRVKKAHPAASFALVGGGDLRNPSSLTADELAALKSLGAVEWIDEVSDVRPYIASADVLVLPSYREGLPRTLLEGAAMGRALIATDAPGCREVVRSAEVGYLVKIADVTSLAGAMMSLCESPQDIPALGRRARSLAESRFDERLVNEACLLAYAERTMLSGCRSERSRSVANHISR